MSDLTPVTRTSTIPVAAVEEFAAAVRAGLRRPGQKELPSRYLYDEVGSALFDAITVLPEYGLTRAGERLLRRHAGEVVERLSSPVIVAELGSGSGGRARFILRALGRRQPTTYYPIEISASALARCELEMGAIEAVSVVGLEKPYLDGLQAAASRRRADEQMLVLFLGGTIGNFDRPAGVEFLRGVRKILAPGDALLLAADLMKPVPALIAAYDDATGVTAAFNRNLLARINRELAGDFDLARWQHAAIWNEADRRIEMHLRSLVEQTVAIRRADLRVSFRKDETIWTESSHRYTADELAGMGERSGFACDAQWIDEAWPFAQSLLIAR